MNTQSKFYQRPALSIATLLAGLILTSPGSKAYYETAETGEIAKKGIYQVSLMPQVRLSDGSGMNFTGFFDAGLTDATSVRFLVGGGETDFYTGGSFKWIPFPDYDKQPALGAKAEMIYGRKSSESQVSLRVHPMLSKKFETDQGLLIPYAAFPIGTLTYNSKTETPLNFVAGTEFITPEVDNMKFGIEIGLNANKSFSYLSAFATLMIDENRNSPKGK